jgi:hypothetical protein
MYIYIYIYIYMYTHINMLLPMLEYNAERAFEEVTAEVERSVCYDCICLGDGLGN